MYDRLRTELSQLKPKTPSEPPFEFSGGDLCLDFADTVNERTTDHPVDLLSSYARLLQWGEEAGAITTKTAERLRHLAQQSEPEARTALRKAVQLRDALYDLFAALSLGDAVPGEALATVNTTVRQASQHAEIVQNQGTFRWQWINPESNLDAVLWPVSRAASDLLSSQELIYVRQCAADDCAWLFVDKTKNHRRRWCDMKICGNRDKARRYYHKKKAG